jgi:8-oxo-dGTP diphosphatase
LENNPTWQPVVALALGDGAGRWLMHRRPFGKQHGGLWEFPGGKVESEEIPALALVREVAEELDILVRPGDLEPVGFADGTLSGGGRPIVLFLYECQKWTGEPTAMEGGEVAWCTAQQIAALDKPPLDRVLERQLAQKHRG